MHLEIGGNLYQNTDGTIEIEGVPQLTVSLRKPEGPLLINFVAFDEAGRVTAKVVDSTMAFNERRTLDLTKTQTSLTLTHHESGTVVLQVELNRPDHVVVTQGEFVTAKGHPIEITPTEWRIEKRRMSGGKTDVKGGAAAIG